MNGLIPRSAGTILARVETSSLASRLTKGALWSVVGAVFSRFFHLASFILVARVLGKERFGELGIIQSTLGMFGAFAGFGLGLTATKHVAEFRSTDPAKAGRIMALSTLTALVMGGLTTGVLVVYAPWLASRTLAAPHLAGPLRIGASLVLLGALIGTQAGALTGFEAFGSIARVNLLSGLLLFPLMVGGSYCLGLEGAVWGLVISQGINWLLNHTALRKHTAGAAIPFQAVGGWQERSVLWKFSLPAALGAVMVGPVMWACNAMLVNQPNGYSEMGLFNAANQWRIAILFFPMAASRMVLPILTDLRSLREMTGYTKTLRLSTAFNGILALAVALPVCILAEGILRVYGNDFASAHAALILLAISAVPQALNNVVGDAITSRGHMWIGFVFNLMWGTVLLILTYGFVHSGYGATGLALATLTAYIAHTLWQAGYVVRQQNER